MFNFLRAVGCAAAALGFTATPALANPFMAIGAEPALIAAALPRQEAIPAKPAELALNSVQLPAALSYETDFRTPLSEQLTARPLVQALPAPKLEKAPAALAKPPVKSLADLVSHFARTDVSDAEQECLAGAVYFESKGEPLEGQLAVAKVIINRAGSGKYPKSLCGVVKQKSQFSFVRGGRIPPIRKSEPAWRKAVAIAQIAKKNLASGIADSALFFHARYVSPSWRGLKRIATVGNHIFYR